MIVPRPSRRQRLAKVFFAYGCMSTLIVAMVHLTGAVLARPEWLVYQFHWKMWFALFVLHSLVLVCTIGPDPTLTIESGWDPVFNPSTKAVRYGRTVLLVAFCNFTFWVFRPFWMLPLGPEVAAQEILGTLSSFVLLSAAYIAVHWALRPENVFSSGILSFLESPLGGRLLVPIMRRATARSRAVAFDEWLSGTLEACESAARSASTVPDVTVSDSTQAIDCYEFQSRVLHELESRASILHHRRRLSHDGYKEIRRFIRSVESIQCSSPSQLKWQCVINDAKSILAMRSRSKLLQEN